MKRHFTKAIFNRYIISLRLGIFSAALISAVNLSGCRRDVVDNVHPPANEVWLQNTAFNPPSITVKAGTTVTWLNKDDFDHTVTSYTGLFDSGFLHSGLPFSYTFTSVGTYQYLCEIHVGMSGTVIVQ